MKRTLNEKYFDALTRVWFNYCKENESTIKSYRPRPIWKCQACYYTVPVLPNNDIYVMQSYNTIVAVIVPFNNEWLCLNFMHLAFHFDEYITAATTTQQVHKFMKLFGAPVKYHRIPKEAI